MFLQDIAVKLNDFGVLVQLLVVDFFKFCFRNANVANNISTNSDRINFPYYPNFAGRIQFLQKYIYTVISVTVIE